MYSEILRYMSHQGKVDARLNKLISSCLEKIALTSTPRYVIKRVSCSVVNDETVKLDLLDIKSRALASHLVNCENAYVMVATLGASVDRLIAQRSVIDPLEALCLQACAATEIEKYCNNIQEELKIDAEKHNLHITSRFSPGYSDFDITHQQDILRLLNAQKRIGVTETKSHMLSPLKTVTAIIGVGNQTNKKTLRSSALSALKKINKCANCEKLNCQFRAVKGNSCD